MTLKEKQKPPQGILERLQWPLKAIFDSDQRVNDYVDRIRNQAGVWGLNRLHRNLMDSVSWLETLFNTGFVLQTFANVTVMFCVLSAFKSTRNRAFLLLFLAYLIGSFDTICDHTIGLQHMTHLGFVAYRTLRKFTYFSDIIIGATGVILLSRSYLKLLEPKDPDVR